jgi:hypothetical protein
MKTEKEIRNRLEWLLKMLDEIKADYDSYKGTAMGDKFLLDICEDWDRCEIEIGALKWVLGEK